jgi:hypothetical protein
VLSSAHARPEKEDPADEGIEDKGRSDQERKGRALQQRPTSDPNEAGVEGEGEG